MFPFEWLLSPVYQFNLEHPWRECGVLVEMDATIPPQNVFISGRGITGGSEEGHTEFALVGLDHPGGVSL